MTAEKVCVKVFCANFDLMNESARHRVADSTVGTASEKQRRNLALKTKPVCCGVA
jgi:hypothetical protein